MVGVPAEERVTRLEEALAECLAWIREQDIYQDNLSGETSWLPRLNEIRSPLGDHYDPESLRAYIGQTLDLVSRASALYAPGREEAALARARLRRRAQDHRLT